MTSHGSGAALRVLFAAASAMTYIGQIMAGHTHPVFAVAVATLTILALRSNADRWVLLLALVHLSGWLLGVAPSSAIQWAGAVFVAVGLVAVHQLTPWLAWARVQLTVNAAVVVALGQPIVLVAAVATGTAAFASAGFGLANWGAALASVSLLVVVAAATVPRVREQLKVMTR